MHTHYTTHAVRQFRDRQLQDASAEDILRQADRAELLLGELDPKRTYSTANLLARIAKKSGRNIESAEVVAGRQLRSDLRLFIEDATEAAGLTPDSADQPVLTMQDLARELHVSTKTIARWRKQGLVSRRFVSEGRLRVGFLRSSVEQFVSENGDRVRRGSEFSQLSDAERRHIVAEARKLVHDGCWPAEVTKRLALVTGRNVETIRYTLKHHDQQCPGDPLFPDHYGPPRPETVQRIYQQFRRGESLEALSKRFCRTKASIQRIVLRMRAKRILELPLDYIPSDEFVEMTSTQEREILGPMPESDQPARKVRLPKGLPSYLASLYEVPLLTREQEAHLFRQMNCLKYKAHQIRAKLDPERPRVRLMNRIERLHQEAVKVKNQILRANLRLVVSIAKRHVGPTVSFFELVSDGNISLIRAVEKFDYSRGNKFSTYASWAIMKNFARSIPGELRQIDRFRTGLGELFVMREDIRSDQQELEMAQSQRQAQIERILKRLGEREQEIIVSRYGLNRGEEPRTLQQVGADLGVTKERIRQLEARALRKLRLAAEEENIAFSI
ncbi:MAG: sigma-70 family RNA polymerase sigma factor [Rhodopirellula sp.]|nr:sigma-70 family RNA polymerase sigma factor [Rhodopirellula sp.]